MDPRRKLTEEQCRNVLQICPSTNEIGSPTTNEIPRHCSFTLCDGIGGALAAAVSVFDAAAHIDLHALDSISYAWGLIDDKLLLVHMEYDTEFVMTRL